MADTKEAPPPPRLTNRGPSRLQKAGIALVGIGATGAVGFHQIEQNADQAINANPQVASMQTAVSSLDRAKELLKFENNSSIENDPLHQRQIVGDRFTPNPPRAEEQLQEAISVLQEEPQAKNLAAEVQAIGQTIEDKANQPSAPAIGSEQSGQYYQPEAQALENAEAKAEQLKEQLTPPELTQQKNTAHKGLIASSVLAVTGGVTTLLATLRRRFRKT